MGLESFEQRGRGGGGVRCKPRCSAAGAGQAAGAMSSGGALHCPPATSPRGTVTPGWPGWADQAWVLCAPGSGQAGRAQRVPQRRPGRPRLPQASPSGPRLCFEPRTSSCQPRQGRPRRLLSPGKGPPFTATVCSLSRGQMCQPLCSRSPECAHYRAGTTHCSHTCEACEN